MAKEYDRAQLEMMVDGSITFDSGYLYHERFDAHDRRWLFFLSGAAFNNILLFITKGVNLKSKHCLCNTSGIFSNIFFISKIKVGASKDLPFRLLFYLTIFSN